MHNYAREIFDLESFFKDAIGEFNFIEPLLTLSLLIIYRAQITPLGYIYFLLEIVIVSFIAYFEKESKRESTSAIIV